jgi:hypothetical protein
LSIPAQEAACREWARGNGFEVVAALTDAEIAGGPATPTPGARLVEYDDEERGRPQCITTTSP